MWREQKYGTSAASFFSYPFCYSLNNWQLINIGKAKITVQIEIRDRGTKLKLYDKREWEKGTCAVAWHKECHLSGKELFFNWCLEMILWTLKYARCDLTKFKSENPEHGGKNQTKAQKNL